MAAPPPSPPPPAEAEGCSCEEGAPAWVLTFGDLMSLLLTFFILLYSMSSSDAAKFNVAAQSLREALGEMSGEFTSATLVPTDELEAGTIASGEAITDAAMEVIAARLQQFVEDNGLEESVEVSKEANGVFLRMQDQALFSPASASIDAAAEAAVAQLGEIVKMIGIPVIVSGHTDNVPIRSGAFPSNWELSAARAAGVARALVGQGRDPSQVTVEAYGDQRPLGDNSTPEGRAENRRVEVYYSREVLQSELEDRGVIETTDETEDGAAVTPDSPTPTPDPSEP